MRATVSKTFEEQGRKTLDLTYRKAARLNLSDQRLIFRHNFFVKLLLMLMMMSTEKESRRDRAQRLGDEDLRGVERSPALVCVRLLAMAERRTLFFCLPKSKVHMVKKARPGKKYDERKHRR